MRGTDVNDVDVMEVDTVSRIQNREGRRSHISRCIERGELGMKRSLFMCEGKVVGASTWESKHIPLGLPQDNARVQELIEGVEITVFRAGGSWVFCSDEGICGDDDPAGQPRATLIKVGLRDTMIDRLSRNRCYAFVAQVPGVVSANGIAFTRPRCYCVAVWNWVKKGELRSLPVKDWDAVDCLLPRTFTAEEGMSFCRRLTPESCVGIVGSNGTRLVRHVNADMIRLGRVRDGTTKAFAICIQQASVHSLAGYKLSDTCRKLAESGVEPRYVEMYREAVHDLWKIYMREKVWKTCPRSPVKIVQCLVDGLHKEYIKRIGLENSRTDPYRVQLYFASKCPASLADVIMRWRERFPKAVTP